MAELIHNLELKCDQQVEDKLDKTIVLDRLNDLRFLPDGWNSYGAASINPAILAELERFVSDIPSDLVTTPQVVPMTRGRVQLEWHRGNRSLELEFETPESVHYLKCDSIAGVEEEDILAVREHGKILDLLHWFSAK